MSEYHVCNCGCGAEMQALRKHLDSALSENVRLRKALQEIFDCEHYKTECFCYLGDNGYCCARPIAKDALENHETKASEGGK